MNYDIASCGYFSEVNYMNYTEMNCSYHKFDSNNNSNSIKLFKINECLKITISINKLFLLKGTILNFMSSLFSYNYLNSIFYLSEVTDLYMLEVNYLLLFYFN